MRAANAAADARSRIAVTEPTPELPVLGESALPPAVVELAEVVVVVVVVSVVVVVDITALSIIVTEPSVTAVASPESLPSFMVKEMSVATS